jgi:hypothetical protein
MRIRSDITKGARYRAGCFAFSFIKREYAFPSNTRKLIGHLDSLENRQKCSHCRFDARGKMYRKNGRNISAKCIGKIREVVQAISTKY